MKALQLLAASVLRLSMTAAIVLIAVAAYLPIESASTAIHAPNGSQVLGESSLETTGRPPHTSPIPPRAAPCLGSCQQAPLQAPTSNPIKPPQYRCDTCPPATAPDQVACDHVVCYPCPPCTYDTTGGRKVMVCPMIACQALNDTTITPQE